MAAISPDEWLREQIDTAKGELATHANTVGGRLALATLRELIALKQADTKIRRYADPKPEAVQGEVRGMDAIDFVLDEVLRTKT